MTSICRGPLLQTHTHTHTQDTAQTGYKINTNLHSLKVHFNVELFLGVNYFSFFFLAKEKNISQGFC